MASVFECDRCKRQFRGDNSRERGQPLEFHEPPWSNTQAFFNANARLQRVDLCVECTRELVVFLHARHGARGDDTDMLKYQKEKSDAKPGTTLEVPTATPDDDVPF